MRIRQGDFAIEIAPVRCENTQALRGFQYTLFRVQRTSEIMVFVSRLFEDAQECETAGEELLHTRVQEELILMRAG